MKGIKKIVITSESGFGPYEDAYTDKLTLTEKGIRYSYDPTTKPPIKWSYRASSADYKDAFVRIAELTDAMLCREETCGCCDVGVVEFTITYEDKTKQSRRFIQPIDDFSELFRAILEIIPQNKDISEGMLSCPE